MTPETLLPFIIFGGAALALVAGIGAWIWDNWSKQRSKSCTELTYSSTSHKLEIIVFFIMFFFIFSMVLMIGKHFEGVIGNLIRKFLLSLSGTTKIPAFASLFMVTGLGFALSIPFSGVAAKFFSSRGRYWQLLGEKLVAVSFGLCLAWWVVFFILMDIKPRWFTKGPSGF